jgi:hypothetical protein
MTHLTLPASSALTVAYDTIALVLLGQGAVAPSDEALRIRRCLGIALDAISLANKVEAGDPTETAQQVLEASYARLRPDHNMLPLRLEKARIDSQLDAAIGDRERLIRENAALRARIKELTLAIDVRAGDKCERELADVHYRDLLPENLENGA